MNIDPLYSYETLLNEAYEHINPNINRDINVVCPEVRISGPKTNFINFVKVCGCLDRDSDHLKHYLETELSTTSSVNIDGVLIINGKFRSKGIQNVLVKYINSYVQCTSCHSIKTLLERENKLRLIKCCNCHSTRYVN